MKAEIEVMYSVAEDHRKLAAIAIRLPAGEDGKLHPLFQSDEEVGFERLFADWGEPDGECRRCDCVVDSETWTDLLDEVEICVSTWTDTLKTVVATNRSRLWHPEPRYIVLDL